MPGWSSTVTWVAANQFCWMSPRYTANPHMIPEQRLIGARTKRPQLANSPAFKAIPDQSCPPTMHGIPWVPFIEQPKKTCRMYTNSTLSNQKPIGAKVRKRGSQFRKEKHCSSLLSLCEWLENSLWISGL